MIVRHWRGVTHAHTADRYLNHLGQEVLPQLRAIPGFRDARVLRRDQDGGTEFIVMTTWDSLEAIRRFAGEDLERAVVPPEAQALMREFDETVAHYEEVATAASRQ